MLAERYARTALFRQCPASTTHRATAHRYPRPQRKRGRDRRRPNGRRAMAGEDGTAQLDADWGRCARCTGSRKRHLRSPRSRAFAGPSPNLGRDRLLHPFVRKSKSTAADASGRARARAPLSRDVALNDGDGGGGDGAVITGACIASPRLCCWLTESNSDHPRTTNDNKMRPRDGTALGCDFVLCFGPEPCTERRDGGG